MRHSSSMSQNGHLIAWLHRCIQYPYARTDPEWLRVLAQCDMFIWFASEGKSVHGFRNSGKIFWSTLESPMYIWVLTSYVLSLHAITFESHQHGLFGKFDHIANQKNIAMQYFKGQWWKHLNPKYAMMLTHEVIPIHLFVVGVLELFFKNNFSQISIMSSYDLSNN